MSRRRNEQLTPGQAHVLNSAGADGRITDPDGRVLPGLDRRAWVRKVTTTPRARKGRSAPRPRVHWEITAAGREALAALPVVKPAERPQWRRTWTVQRVSPHDYVIDASHRVYRTARDSAWTVLCPDLPTGDVAACVDTLAEAVEALADHLYRTECERRPALLPLSYYEAAMLARLTDGPTPTEPEPVDLDTVTAPAVDTAPGPRLAIVPVPVPAGAEPVPAPSAASSTRPPLRLVDVEHPAAELPEPADVPAVLAVDPGPRGQLGLFGEAAQLDLFGEAHQVERPVQVGRWCR